MMWNVSNTGRGQKANMCKKVICGRHLRQNASTLVSPKYSNAEAIPVRNPRKFIKVNVENKMKLRFVPVEKPV